MPLPTADEAALTERTRHTLRFLHEARAGARAERRRNSALLVYGIALVALSWGAPFLIALARTADTGRPPGATSQHVLAGLPAAAPALALLTLVLTTRSAVWRGPVLLDAPTVSRLLPLPLLRGPLLRPRLYASLLRATVIGLVAGAVLGFLAGVARGGGSALPAAAGAWGGVVTAAWSVALGALVERHDRTVARCGRWLFGGAWTLTAAHVAVATQSAVQGTPSSATSVLLWSGPWGWAFQPLLATVGAVPPVRAAGTAVCVTSTLVVLLAAHRQVPLITGTTLRSRATVASRLTASLFTFDLRQARSAVRTPRNGGGRPSVRLPVPRNPQLVVPWRDATALLRAPGRLVWAGVWGCAALASAALALAPDGQVRAALLVAALAAEYLAAAQLAEPARLESDDLRRAANLPYTPGGLALRHAVVPGALLLVGLGAATAVLGASAVLGNSAVLNSSAALGVSADWRFGLLLLLAALPACVGAALVSAYRGPTPTHLLIGTETPAGNTGAAQVLLWYARGPLTMLLLSAPVLTAASRDGHLGAGHAAWLLLVGAGLHCWAHRTARALHAPVT